MPLSPEDLQHIAERTLAHDEQHAQSYWEGTRDHDLSQNIAALLRRLPGPPPFDLLDTGRRWLLDPLPSRSHAAGPTLCIHSTCADDHSGWAHDRPLAEVTAAEESLKPSGRGAVGRDWAVSTPSCPSGFSEAARCPGRPPAGFASRKQAFVATGSRWPEAVASGDPERPAPVGTWETQATCREPEFGPGG